MHGAVGIHHYRESGLDNVYLESIPMYECSDCKTQYPSIFRLGRLSDLIALTLVQKPALLSGREIKFLRKNLKRPSHIFAKELGVGKTTLSKWENDLQNHSEGNDRLIRAIYLIAKGIEIEDQQNIHRLLRRISLKNSHSQYVIVAEKVRKDYMLKYRPVVESESRSSSSIDSPDRIENRSISSSGTILGFKLVAGNEQTYAQQAKVPAIAAANFISKGIEAYGTQTTEI